MGLFEYIIIFGSVVVLIAILIIIFLKRKKVEVKKPTIDFDPLLEALGTIDNIKDVTNIQNRVKIIIKDLKKVSTTKLKELNIPATLKSQELTLLLKNQSVEFINFIKKGNNWND